MALTACLRLLICGGLFLATVSPLLGSDCNGNSVSDADEIAAGHSEDCNLNSIPDECEASPPPFGSALRLHSASVSSLASADLDGDGRLDVVVGTARSGNFGLSLLLGSGDGHFLEGGWLPNTRDVLAIVAAELDGDGRADLVLLDAGGVRAFFNEGAGSFSGRVTVSSRDDMSAIAAADLNEDGLQDVVATQRAGNLVAVFLSRGDRTFEPLADRQVTAPAGMAASDIDADGDLDLVVAAGTGISLLASVGVGNLEPAGQVQGMGSHPRWPVLGDVDGDGRTDIVLATDSGVVVFLGRGAATFEAATAYEVNAGDREVTALALGDVDCDGDLDVSVGMEGPSGSGELLFLVNDGAAVFRFASLPGLEGSPGFLEAMDPDGDGDQDLLIVPPGRDRVEVLWNDGGILEREASLSFTRKQVSLSERFEPHASAIKDIDDDGDLDVITMNGEDLVMVLVNPGNGQLLEGERYTMAAASELISLVSVDFDGDGDFDVAANDEAEDILVVLLNQGDGTFVQTPEMYPVGGQPSFLAAGDIDGDGSPDLASSSRDDDTVGILIGRGNGLFESEVVFPVGDNPVAVALGDFGGDGHADLAVASSGSSTLSVFTNRGDGSFRDPVVMEISTPRYVITVDLEGDGDLDLVTAHEGGRALRLFSNDGRGTFAPGGVIDLGGRPRSVFPCELNQDGLADFATANEQDDSICIVMSSAPGAYTPAATYAVGLDPRYALAGDLDGDGDSDVLAANHSSFDFSVFFSQAAGIVLPSYLERICTELDYFKMCRAVNVPRSTARAAGADWTTRFLIPSKGGVIPTLFENVRLHATQREFLAAVFPEMFPELTDAQYSLLVGRRATRQYYSGQVDRLRSTYGAAYGFDVVVDSSSDPGELLTMEEARAVFQSLKGAFSLAPLVYHPSSPAARERAAAWVDPGFPIWMAPFRRGDCSVDGKVNLTDAVVILDRLFRGGPALLCQEAADANDDGELDISDAVFLLLYLFLGSQPLGQPLESCGWDPTPDSLPCVEFPPCEV